jgi:23S rRNA G2445 N2-methylase RlmL
MLLGEYDNITDFDSFFECVEKIDWKQYVKGPFPIVIKATSVASELHSTPTLQ